MSEIPGNFESRESDTSKHPDVLDIIRINGRWAQVCDTHTPGEPNVLKYLDDGTAAFVSLEDYELRKHHSTAVRNLLDDHPGLFSSKEINNIHWDSTTHDKYPELRLEVKVFGEYEKKSVDSL